MVRPVKCRRVQNEPVARFYKPQGVPVKDLTVVYLKEEELEALSLADAQGMDHEEAASSLGISRSTFSRILSRARKTVTQALIQGAALRIEGGDFMRTHPTRSSGECCSTERKKQNV